MLVLYSVVGKRYFVRVHALKCAYKKRKLAFFPHYLRRINWHNHNLWCKSLNWLFFLFLAMGSFLSDDGGSLTLNLKLRSMTNHLLADYLD